MTPARVLETDPGFFRCEKLRVIMRKKACALRHAEAQSVDDNTDVVRLFECIDCPVGQANAKEELVRIRVRSKYRHGRRGRFNHDPT